MKNPSAFAHKVQPEHLGRKAIVYLRQSSDKQVRENLESQRGCRSGVSSHSCLHATFSVA